MTGREGALPRDNINVVAQILDIELKADTRPFTVRKGIPADRKALSEVLWNPCRNSFNRFVRVLGFFRFVFVVASSVSCRSTDA